MNSIKLFIGFVSFKIVAEALLLIVIFSVALLWRTLTKLLRSTGQK